MTTGPTFSELIEATRDLPEAEQMRELCALLCNAHAVRFWARGAQGMADGARACARAIRLAEDLEERILLLVPDD